MKKKANILAALVAGFVLGAASQVSATTAGSSIVDVAIDLNTNTNSPYYGQFDILIGAVLAADPAVAATLSHNGQNTVFAPVDAAFEAVGITEENVDEIDQAFLTEVLLYHVVKGRRAANSVLKSKQLRTLQGGLLLQSGGVLADGLGRPANIIVTDVEASNGIIHAIDAVVLPFEAPTLVDLVIELNSNTNSPYFGQFDVLIGAVLAADPIIVATLSYPKQRTVFAPVDAAFEAIGVTEENVGDLDPEFLTGVLAYHVTNGRRTSQSVVRAKKIRMAQGGFLQQDSGVLIDGLGREANIIATDLMAKNGIIHVIDSVVLPFEAPTLVDLAIELNSNTNSPYFGEFDILIGAVLAADPAIVATLSARGQRTVFAPVDAAFEGIGITEENVGTLDPQFLAEVLAYHVTNGRRTSQSVVRSKKIRMLQKGFLQQDSGVLTDGLGRKANIVATDLMAKNGIIHAIDNVVLPFEAPTIVDLAVELNTNENSPYFGEFDILIGAILAADPAVLDLLTARGQRTVFAPVDSAFEALGITEENVGDLDPAFLTDVLAYHVTKGRRTAKTVLKKKSLSTLQGEALLQNSGVLTDVLGRTSNIIVTDLMAKNGIVHAIDTVVLPYSPE
jgi:transforming growth factor-beta-induced protein